MVNSAFSLEVELSHILDTCLAQAVLPHTEPDLIHRLCQQQVRHVIPDFVLVHFGEMSPKIRKARTLTPLESWIVASLLAVGTLTGSTIADRLYSKLERIGPSLNSLQRYGIVDRLPSGSYFLTNPVRLRQTQIIAVEVKLKRWRDAVRQAATYLQFSNQAYVALPESVVENNKALLAESESAKIGILAVGEDSVSVFRYAPLMEAMTADWIWLLSRVTDLGQSTTQYDADMQGKFSSTDWTENPEMLGAIHVDD
jgi:hypothetical protein